MPRRCLLSSISPFCPFFSCLQNSQKSPTGQPQGPGMREKNSRKFGTSSVQMPALPLSSSVTLTSLLSASVSLSKQCNIPSLVVVPINWCMQSAWLQCLAPRKHPVSVRLIPIEAAEGGESCPGSSSFPRVALLLLQLSPPWLSIFLCRL